MAHPERYLHSTMLLLYLTHPAGLFLPVIPFTFHYASTLSDCARHCVMEFFIYIPLCFYFIEISEKYQNILKPIYIPLCFYFICLLQIYQTYWIAYLHSTMLLLYLENNREICEAFPEFTFHYASTLSQSPTLRSRNAKKIYIPLCFYFIDLQNITQSLGFYHLHSTMLLLYPPDRRTWKRQRSTFTFHYASTLSAERARLQWSCNRIYIPLCFYFIHRRIDQSGQSNSFTFHYASTLSRIPARSGVPAFPFTFHYASTLSGKRLKYESC